MRCSVCRQSCRKTTIIHIARAEGLKRRRVCASCLRHTVTIYVGGHNECQSCPEPATMCAACVDKSKSLDAKALLQKIERRLRGLARAYVADDDMSRAAIYTSAAEQIDAELRQLKGPSP